MELVVEGGQGRVYKQGNYAIKVPNTFQATEAIILNSISHPYIVKLEGVEKIHIDGKDLYGLVMPFYSSCKQYQPTQTIEQLLFIYKIAIALHFLHTHSILHRDIKLSNILVDKGNPIICDFGLSCVCNVKTGILINECSGTLGYLPPEIKTNNLNLYNEKGDVWSFAMVILRRLCGNKKPSISNIICKEEYRRDIENLLHGMLSENPLKRYNMADVVHHSLFEIFSSPQLGHILTPKRETYYSTYFDVAIQHATECYLTWAISSTIKAYLLTIEILYSILPHIDSFNILGLVYAAVNMARNVCDGRCLINKHAVYLKHVGNIGSLVPMYTEKICEWTCFFINLESFGNVNEFIQTIFTFPRLYGCISNGNIDCEFETIRDVFDI
jgi:serine/threonine protein kinase